MAPVLLFSFFNLICVVDFCMICQSALHTENSSGALKSMLNFKSEIKSAVGLLSVTDQFAVAVWALLVAVRTVFVKLKV